MRGDDSLPRRLTFAAEAWLKWQFLCHAGPTEVAAFGLSAEDDLLFVEDLLVVRQRATTVSVACEDAAIADLFDELVDAGFSPARFARIWLHTHPGASADPSRTDEVTFAQAFGSCDWSVMAILSRTGRTYTRLHFGAGPGGSMLLPVAVDWSSWPALASDPHRPFADRVADWQREYETLVVPLDETAKPPSGGTKDALSGFEFWPDVLANSENDLRHPGGLHVLD